MEKHKIKKTSPHKHFRFRSETDKRRNQPMKGRRNHPADTKCPIAVMLMLVAVTFAVNLPAQNAMLTTLVSFNGTNGANPDAGLVEGSDGNFYGTTANGGKNNNGTVFKVTPSGTVTSLVSFADTNGNFPEGGLVQGVDGGFYGTTEGGGSGAGTLFKITTNGVLVSLYSFSNGIGGVSPRAGLVQGSDGNFYGTTYYGGTNGTNTDEFDGFGTVFRMTPSGAVTVLASFDGSTDGGFLTSGLIQGNDGNFYGTSGGGPYDGNIFKVTPSGTLTDFASFDALNGRDPSCLVQGSDGNFYGTTFSGPGIEFYGGGYGTVFKLAPSGTVTSLASFNGTNGAYPTALVQGRDGNFYGTTIGIGTSTGTIFKMTPTGTLTCLFSFDETDCGQLTPGLVQGNDGNFYGTTSGGNSTNLLLYYGTVFRLNIGPSVFSSLFQLPASVEWYDTGINLSAGEIVTITASGSVYVGSIAGGGTIGEKTVPNKDDSSLDYQTPAGSPVGTVITHLPFLAQNLPWWSLIAKVGSSGSPFEIGTGSTFIASGAGELYLSVNDNNFADNSGSWNVTVVQNPNFVAMVSNVRASQRVGTGLVDILYDLSGTPSPMLVWALVSIDGGASYSLPPASITGDGVTAPVVPGSSRHLVWNAGVDYPGQYSSLMRVQLTAITAQAVSPIFRLDTRSTVTGNLSGRVLANGTPLSDAQIRLETTAFATVTANDGTFTLPTIPVGSGYVLDVSAFGYASTRLTKVAVTSGNNNLGDITLTVTGGPYSLVPLVPDVNPAVTTVEEGGTAYRYYCVLNSAGNPQGGVAVTVQIQGGSTIDQTGDVSSYWPGQTAGISDANGVVRVRIPASTLSATGFLPTVQLRVSGKVQQSFFAQVLERQYDQVWKQKLGAGVSVGDFLSAGADSSAESDVRHKIVSGVVAGESISRIQTRDVTAGAGFNVGSSLSVSSKNINLSAGTEASAGINATAAIALHSTYDFDPNSTDPNQNAMKLYVDLGNVLSGVPGPEALFYDYAEGTIEPLFLRSNLRSIEGDVQVSGSYAGSVVLGSGVVNPAAIVVQASVSEDVEAIAGYKAIFGSASESATVKGVAGGGSADASVFAGLSLPGLTFNGVNADWQTSFNVELLKKSWTKQRQSSPYRTEAVRRLSLGIAEQMPVPAWQLYDNGLYQSYAREFTEQIEITNGLNLTNYQWSVYAEQQSFGANLNLDLGLGVSLQGKLDTGAEVVNERGAILPRGAALYWPTESYPAITGNFLPSQSWLSLLQQWGSSASGVIGEAIHQAVTDIHNDVNNTVSAVNNSVGATLNFGQGVMNEGSQVISSWTAQVESVKLVAKSRNVRSDTGLREPGYLPPDGASNYIYGISGIYRFSTTNAFAGSARLAISYQASQATGLTPTNLQIYQLPEGSNSWQLIGGTVDTVSNIVSGTITNLGTYAIAPPMPTGTLQLIASSNALAADGVSQMTVLITNLLLNTGAAATQQWLFTVTADGVKILNQDGDTNLPGIQVISTNGALTLVLQAPLGGTVAHVSVASVAGDAVGSTAINLMDNTPPAAPTIVVVSAGQSRIWVSWKTNSEPDLAAYRVYYNAGVVGPPWNGTAAVEGSPSPVQVTATNCLLRGLALGTNYFIAVSAVDTSGNESSLSRIVQVTTVNSPPAPPMSAAVRFRPDGTNFVMWGLSEDDGFNDRDVIRYDVFRAILPSGAYAKVGEVSAGIGFYSEPTVKIPSGKSIGYAVSAVNNIGVSSTESFASVGDLTPPKMAIIMPIGGQQFSNAVITAKGTATDNVAVSAVLCQLSGSGWQLATTTNNWTNWIANLPALTPGANTLTAYAVDTSGNISGTNTVGLTFIPSATLTVRTNGLGSISPIYNGKLLAINTNYILTTSPSKNWLFSNWVGGTSAPYTVLTNGPKLTFAMESNLVLWANFVTNPFPAIAGSFNGLFYQTNGSPTEQSSGFVTITIASTSKGAYSAKLVLDGGTNSFTGAFDLTGNSVTNLTRKGKSPLTVTLNVALNTVPPATFISGTVTASNWAAPSGLLADLAVFNGTTVKATNYAGKYTFVVPGSTTPMTSPGGYGAATFTNNLAGTAVLAGALGDSASINQSAPISQDGLVPVYVPLYGGQELIFGWLTFSNVPPRTVSGDLTWFKLSSPAKAPYTNGFTNQTPIIGSVYVPWSTNILALTNGTLTITDPGQGIELVYTNVTVHSNKLSYTAPPTNQLVVTFTPSSGAMSVNFRPTGAKTNITAQGVVLQDAAGELSLKAAGWFLGTNESGWFELMGQ